MKEYNEFALAKLEELVNWGAPMIIKFREVFAPLIKNIEMGTST